MQAQTKLSGRECEKCSLCCKLLRIDELQKPAGDWCKHCAPGKRGCTIYDRRPPECAHFFCMWLTSEQLDPAWMPLTSKMVLHVERQGIQLAVHVDPSYPSRWRAEPYYGQLKRWAVEAADRQRQVVVYVKDRAIAILPDKDVDLGVFSRNDHIMVGARNFPGGRDWWAILVPEKDVPRVARAAGRREGKDVGREPIPAKAQADENSTGGACDPEDGRKALPSGSV